jgi:hypothetical protein
LGIVIEFKRIQLLKNRSPMLVMVVRGENITDVKDVQFAKIP